MKFIPKIKVAAVLLIAVVLIFANVSITMAQTGNSGTVSPNVQNSGTVSPKNSGQQTFTLQNPLNSNFNSVGGLVKGFLEIFTYLVVIFGVLAIVWVGFQFILAQGKPDRLKELGNWLLYIVIGLAIVIGARILVDAVLNTLDATGVVNPQVIQSAKNANNGN